MPRADATRSKRSVVFAAVICNGLEFFDFVAYAFFAQAIGQAFFPSAEPSLQLLLSVGVFGVGFIARPVGGILLGRYADRAGRRPALLLSAVLMTFGTLGLVVTPGYASIGLSAPLLITFFRMVQGFALGGETGPSIAFLLEIAPARRRGAYVALQIASQGGASALAAALGLALSLSLTPAQMLDWGWRVPFAVSVLLIPIALFLRFHMPETLRTTADAGVGVPAPAARPAWLSRDVVLGILIIAAGTVSTYLGSYMTTYGTAILHLPLADGLQASIVVGLTTLVGAVLGGCLADRFGRWPVMFWPRLLTAVICIPAFAWLVAHPDALTLRAISALLAFLTAVSAGGVLTTICELFPVERRAAALALIYSVGVSVFGGTVQFVVTWLIGVTASPMVPAWYIAVSSGVAVVATLLLPETKQTAPAGA